MSTAATPARKPMRPESQFQRLAREMESPKGLDPMPPDQYRYFLGPKESPLQRLLALVRSKTCAEGHRSAFCVDEHGKELRLADLRRELAIDWGNFRRCVEEAKARGLIRVGGRKSPNGGASSHPHRVFLCGSVAESVGYKEQADSSTSLYRLVLLTPEQRKIYDGWAAEKQVRFYADFERVVKYKDDVEKEAIALARAITDRALDQVLAAHALPKKRLPKQRVEPKLVRLALLESVQTESVPTRGHESVPTEECESVPAAASLLSLEKTESVPGSVGQSTEEPTDRPTPIDAIRNLLRNEWGAKLPGERATTPLCEQIVEALAGAPLALLRNRMIQRIEKAESFGFALVLARDIGEQWREDAAKRAKAERAREEHAVANVGQNRLLWQETLDDPQASAEEKRLAVEFLGRAQKAKATGGG